MMNREIKFRCYWKGVNKMFHFIQGNFEDTKKNGYVMAFVQQDGDGSIYLGNVEVMQYTGLKDKNGKEIYEGDIVTIPCPHPFEESPVCSICTVIWLRDGYKLEAPSIIENLHEYTEILELEVIGNIHQNPELLK